MVFPLSSIEFIVTSLIAIPSLLALISAVSYNKALRYFVVYVTFVLLTLISIITFYHVLSSESHLITLSYPPQVDLIIMVMDFGLLLFFLYVGVTRRHPLVILLTILQLLPLIYLETLIHGIKASPTILIDPLSAIMCLIICIIGSLIVIYSLNYMEEHEEHLHLKRTRQPRFFFFMILLLAAMNGVVISNNLYWLYFFWEVTTLCCYQLIRHDLTEQAERNALLALWMGIIGGVAFVSSMFIGVMQLHSLTLSEIINAKSPIYIPLLLALLSLAAFTKSAQVPFHSWLLGAMIAPTPVSALLHSSTMVKAGIYLILRISPGLINFPVLSYS
ncbi:MAG: NADH-quinone oxidoreductase subunit L, partial [Candidatus Korarchaeum sp.]|nr:NADH-quinone oxidoreductase subunit L [Candidatus Korarchaeum sp.]